MERDAMGHFVKGNTICTIGGKARMAALSPAEKRALARQGFNALAGKYFDGRKRKCAAWLFDPLGLQELTR